MRDLAIVLLAGLGLRLAFIALPGHIVDLNTFGAWALGAADHPWPDAYAVTDMNYPPGALIIFELIGRAYRRWVHADPDGSLLHIALKLPSIGFDLAGAGAAYAIARGFVEHRPALVACAAIALNPAIVYDSAVWGQNDSITAACALGAVALLLRGKPIVAWALFAFAVLNKPPVVVIAPLFGLEPFVRPGKASNAVRIGRCASGVLAALATAYLTALPFYPEREPLALFGRVIAWYRIGSSLYPFTSANAFNLYAFAGDFFAPDTVRIGFLALATWADLAYIALAAFLCVRYVLRPDGRTFVACAFLLMLGFFALLTEMHERYLVYALFFGAPLVALDGRMRAPFIAITLTQWFNLEYSLSYMWLNSDKPAGIDPDGFAPVLARVCAATNLAVLGLGIARLVERPKGTLPQPP